MWRMLKNNDHLKYYMANVVSNPTMIEIMNKEEDDQMIELVKEMLNK